MINDIDVTYTNYIYNYIEENKDKLKPEDINLLWDFCNNSIEWQKRNRIIYVNLETEKTN